MMHLAFYSLIDKIKMQDLCFGIWFQSVIHIFKGKNMMYFHLPTKSDS